MTPKRVDNGSPAELFTLGYEGFVPDTYFDTIQAAGVSTLVDVRRLPQSRKPGFSKKRLLEIAESRGLRYVHMVALGTPREILYHYRSDHNHAEFERRYLEYLDTQPEALAELAELMKVETCCLLCVEAEPTHCHRRIVAESVQKLIGSESLAITHLR